MVGRRELIFVIVCGLPNLIRRWSYRFFVFPLYDLPTFLRAGTKGSVRGETYVSRAKVRTRRFKILFANEFTKRIFPMVRVGEIVQVRSSSSSVFRGSTEGAVVNYYLGGQVIMASLDNSKVRLLVPIRVPVS